MRGRKGGSQRGRQEGRQRDRETEAETYRGSDREAETRKRSGATVGEADEETERCAGGGGHAGETGRQVKELNLLSSGSASNSQPPNFRGFNFSF